MAPSSSVVYGSFGRTKTSSTVPRSTTLPQDDPCDGRLARPGLVDDRGRRAAGHVERDAVRRADGLTVPAAQPVLLHQVGHRQHAVGREALRRIRPVPPFRCLLHDRTRAARRRRRDGRGCRDQPLGVLVLRVAEDGLRGALLDDVALEHDDDAVGAVRCDAEVMRDEQQRRAVRVDERLQVVEDVPLHGDVERTRRLIRDEELGLPRQRGRDENALPHAAGELVRELPGPAFRLRDPRLGHQLDDPLLDGRPPAHAAGGERVRDLRAHLHRRVQVGRGVLRDEADALAADPAHVALVRDGEVVPAERDRTARDVPCSGQESEDRRDDRRLAGPGLPDDGDPLAGRDVEVDAVQHLLAAERDPEIADGQEGRGRVILGRRVDAGGGAVPPSVLLHRPVLLGGSRRRTARRSRDRGTRWRAARATSHPLG